MDNRSHIVDRSASEWRVVAAGVLGGRLSPMSTTVLAAAGALVAEGEHALPMPAISYGLIALVFFALLLGVTWAFRNTGQKYAPPSEHGDHAHGHGTVERHR